MWTRRAVEELQAGREVTVRPHGQSMKPKVMSGATVTLAPIDDPAAVGKGEIVLAKVKGRIYLHLVSAVEKDRVQISNNHGHVNGWTSRSLVYGRAVKIDNSTHD